MRKNKHSNLHLQRAYNIDGENSFVYDLVEKCKKDDLIKKEEYYIKEYNACDDNFGYNMNEKADIPPNWKGRKHSEETKKKMSKSQKGRIVTDYMKKVDSDTHKGKKISEENKKQLSKKNKGKGNPMYGKKPYDIWLGKYGKEEADKRLEKWKHNLSESNKGRIISEETRKKIGIKHKGKKISNETKEKLSRIKLGKKASIETKLKMSEKRKGEKNPACKIKDNEVIEILKMVEKGIKIVEIAKKYNVSTVTINNIKKGKRKII